MIDPDTLYFGLVSKQIEAIEEVPDTIMHGLLNSEKQL